MMTSFSARILIGWQAKTAEEAKSRNCTTSALQATKRMQMNYATPKEFCSALNFNMMDFEKEIHKLNKN